MRECDVLLEQLEAGGAAPLTPELAAHLAGCAECQAAVARTLAVGDAAGAVRAVRAPASLVARLKSMPRVPVACDRALERVGEALDGELDGADRDAFLAHLIECAGCRAAWESLATLREAGAHAAAPPLLRAGLSIPPWRRIAPRRRFAFDLRLAAAAAYLLAALTVFMAGNPAALADKGSSGVGKAMLYTRAAVENRAEAVSRRLQEGFAVAQGWALDQAESTWAQVRALFGKEAENPPQEANV